MTEQEVKNIFRSYLPAKRRFAEMLATVKHIRAELDGLKSLVITDMPHGTGVSNPVEEAYAKFENCVQKVAKATLHYAEIIELAESLLELADDIDGKTVIELRWFKGRKFDFIPADLYMQRTAMFSHYNRAIKEISAKTEQREKAD